MYYEKLEEVDKEIEQIEAWQKVQLDKLYAKTAKKISKAMAKLAIHIPEEAKRGRK
jgi:hypothetical protein